MQFFSSAVHLQEPFFIVPGQKCTHGGGPRKFFHAAIPSRSSPGDVAAAGQIFEAECFCCSHSVEAEAEV